MFTRMLLVAPLSLFLLACDSSTPAPAPDKAGVAKAEPAKVEPAAKKIDDETMKKAVGSSASRGRSRRRTRRARSATGSRRASWC